ncbi:pilus assembly FimT family protein [Euhalothece natronophila]|nr:prepilin-type N-terminal cleavage/methylation domain-containing protein [Euhalothece natronophila]
MTKNNQGFNLLEITIVLFIVGILAAISAPNFLVWYRRNQLNQSVSEVKGALIQAQEEAIRRSEECDVDITNNTISSCISTRTLPELINVGIDTDGDTPIRFNLRGVLVDEDGEEKEENYTITFSSEDVPEDLCLRVFSPLGIIRQGVINNGNGACVQP